MFENAKSDKNKLIAPYMNNGDGLRVVRSITPNLTADEWRMIEEIADRIEEQGKKGNA